MQAGWGSSGGQKVKKDLVSRRSSIDGTYFGVRGLTCLRVQLPCSRSHVLHVECEQTTLLLLRAVVPEMSDVCQVILHVYTENV